MSSSDKVRAYQKALAKHVHDHSRAVAKLDDVMARRAELIALQDAAVDAARVGVERAVTEMARSLGPELTADLLDLDAAEVRRMLKATA